MSIGYFSVPDPVAPDFPEPAALSTVLNCCPVIAVTGNAPLLLSCPRFAEDSVFNNPLIADPPSLRRVSCWPLFNVCK